MAQLSHATKYYTIYYTIPVNSIKSRKDHIALFPATHPVVQQICKL